VTRPRHRILGVDPGTRTLGYAIVDCGGPDFEYVECGVLQAVLGTDMATRLERLAAELGEIIAEFRPRVLALEKAFYGRNAASALKLGQARGAIMLLAGQHGVPVFEYTPATIKQSVVGNGRATKAQVQARVQMLFSLRRPPSVDAADALAIALTHAFRLPPSRPSGAEGPPLRG
jgi:crossover junction endodeoxyribonuclease RuvC